MYNSTYGQSYGGSYGSYGSYSSPYGSSSMYGSMRSQQLGQQQNNPNPNSPQQNQRKKIFQEYFKMMGGMRSILQLGFAGVAFYNFGSRSVDLIKKIFMFLLSNSKKFLGFISQYIPIDMMKNALIASTGSKDTLRWQNLTVSLVRIIIVTFLILSSYLRNKIKQQVLVEHQILDKKAEQISQKKTDVMKKLQKYKKQGNL